MLANALRQLAKSERIGVVLLSQLRRPEGGINARPSIYARVLDPIRIKLGLEKLNFQILRRTFATLAVGERKGTLKDVQKQLRYARLDTTLENYVKKIPDSVYQMADAMYDGIASVAGRVQ